VSLSGAQARRLAVAAQGLADPRPTGEPDLRHVRRVLRRVSVVQIDSVNVVERAHRLTLFSRLGPYDPGVFRRAVEGRRELFEYWGHMASFNPVETWPLLRPRMERIRVWARLDRLRRERPEYIERILEEVSARGPLTAAEVADPGEAAAGSWWDWRLGKVALEWLFAKGLVTVSHRTAGFARVYDLPERVIPDRHRLAPVPTEEEARRHLVQRAIRSLGVATAADLIDYYRLPTAAGRETVASLAAEGRLVPVEVEGWTDPAFLDPEASIPRRVTTRALLCPFDSLVWFRPRAERVFGFRYRVEIYVPAPKRRFGYYVFPFLLDDRLVARVDIKADRQRRVLRVPGAFAEDGADRPRVAAALAGELWTMAHWLGLEAVEVGDRGDLAAPLASALG
jgi:hypothetical protein